MLCLHLGTPLSLEQARNGRTFTSLITRGELQIVPARTESQWRHQDGSAFMHVHLTADILQESLVVLASEAGLSPSHFASLFRKTTGLSPHRYVIQRRLEQAQQLLKSTRLSIGEIASAVGFYDQSHLVRHMRRVMGV